MKRADGNQPGPAPVPLARFDVSRTRGPLFGRDQDVAAIVALLSRNDVGLVSLVGAGGVGKTSLALHATARIATDELESTVIINVAALRAPAEFLAELARALTVRESPQSTFSRRVFSAYRKRARLLVLDNFEGVVVAAPVIADLLIACPQLKVLVTSRIALGLSDEHTYVVRPLDAGQTGEHLPVAELRRLPAVQLFLYRAEQAGHALSKGENELRSIATLCMRLDGLPLAIELAAARTRVLSPTAMLSQLSVELLGLGLRDRPDRQQAMRNSIAWSFDLLDAREQDLFVRMAVYPGGCSLDTAIAIGRQASLDDQELLDSLDRLVQASMIHRADLPDGRPRFGMLSLLREFGVERAMDIGIMGALRLHQARLMAAKALNLRDYDPLVSGTRDEVMLEIDAELDNFRTVWDFLVNNQLVPLGAHFVAHAGYFLLFLGYRDEARAWLDWAEDCLDRLEPSQRLEVHLACSLIQWTIGDLERAESLATLAESLAVELGDPDARADAVLCQGRVAQMRGHWDDALRMFEISQGLRTKPGPRLAEATTWTAMGETACEMGDLASSERYFRNSLAVNRQHGNSWGCALVLGNLARIEQERGAVDAAIDFNVEAIALWAPLVTRWWPMREVAAMAAFAVDSGQHIRAALLVGAIDARSDDTGAIFSHVWTGTVLAGCDHARHGARETLGEDRFERWRASGGTLGRAEIARIAREVAAGRQVPARLSLPASAGQLTRRERDVLVLIGEGMTDRQIALELFLSPRTVNIHVGHILAKLGVPSRRHAAIIARDLEAR